MAPMHIVCIAQMTLYNFVDGGPLDMIMGSIVISNAVVMFARD